VVKIEQIYRAKIGKWRSLNPAFAPKPRPAQFARLAPSSQATGALSLVTQ
jgi:hypothetical protein